jgi:hypothetical protein
MLTTPRGESTEALAFLQWRVAQFGLMGAALGSVFLIFRTILVIVAGDSGELLSPSFALHASGILFTLVLWWLCRGHCSRINPHTAAGPRA